MPKEPMTEERIAEIRGREKAATQGPWRDECVIGRRKEIEAFHTIRDKDGAIVDVLPIFAYHDAAFISNARQDIPALLDEVERLRAELENADKRTKFWIYFSALLSGGKSDIGGKLNTSMSFSDLPEMSKEELFK